MRISIIVPLEYHRDVAIECVRGWTQTQTTAPENYQLLLGAPPGFDPEQLAQIRALLRPWDHLETSHAQHDVAIVEEVAKIARAPLLLFSESHCVPQPDALDYLLGIADTHPEWAAFSGPTTGLTDNMLSRVECEMYSQDIRGKLASHDWLRVLDQCFVIHRAAYEAVGGFRSSFGHFAEWLFAAMMKEHKLLIGHCERAVIGHHYTGNYDDLEAFTLDFARGHIRYLHNCPGEPTARLFPSIPELTDLVNRTTPERRRVGRYVKNDSIRTLTTVAGKWWHNEPVGPVFRYTRWATNRWRTTQHGPRQLHTDATAAANRARSELEWAIQHGNAKLAQSRFVEWFSRLSRQGRLGYLVDTLGDLAVAQVPRPAPTSDMGHWTADDAHVEAQVFDIHDAEGSANGTIRWTLPTFQIFVPLHAGTKYSVTLEWSMARPLNRSEVIRVRLNGKPIHAKDLHIEGTRLHLAIHVPRTDWHELAVTVYPFSGMEDDRLLGLPLQRIDWNPIASRSDGL